MSSPLVISMAAMLPMASMLPWLDGLISAMFQTYTTTACWPDSAEVIRLGR
jgi:hypothetical protein